MKTIPISDDVHQKMKIKIASGCAYKTMQDFIDAAVENELRALEE